MKNNLEKKTKKELLEVISELRKKNDDLTFSIQSIRQKKGPQVIENECLHLFDQLNISVLKFSSNEKLTYLNKLFQTKFGYDKKDLPTLDSWFLRAFPDEEYRNLVVTNWKSYILQNNKGDAEQRIVRATTKFSYIINIIFDVCKFADGSFVVFLGDVSDAASSDIELKKSEELNRHIVEGSHDGIIILGEDYKIEFVNDNVCQKTGYQKEDLINKDFRWLLPKDSEHEIIGRFEKKIGGGNPSPLYEFEFKTRTGEIKTFEINSSRFFDSKGKPKIISQFKDITDSKNAQEALKQSEEKFRTIVENSHAGFAMIGSDYKWEYINNKFCEILNYTRDELIGNDLRNYVSSESLDLVVERFIKRQRGENVSPESEITLIRNGGEERIVKLSSTAINVCGEIKTIAQFLDLTENKRNESLHIALLKISQAVNEVENLNDFLGIVQKELSEILDTTNFYVAMYDKFSDTYTFPYHVDEYDKIDQITQLQLKDSLTDYVRRTKNALLMNSETQKLLEERGEVKVIVGESCPVWIGAPLVVGNEVVGVIALQDYHNENAYDQEDVEILKIISENASSAIWKKQIVDKLTVSELRYRDFIARSSEGIHRIDFKIPIDTNLPPENQVKLMMENAIIGECNEAFAEMYGFNSPKSIVGKSISDMYGGNVSKENFDSNLNFVKSNYRITNTETEEVNLTGEKIYILNNSVGVVKDGYLLNIWGIQRDITERKRSEKVLQQIAEGISSSMDDSFFKSMVQYLGDTLQIDYAFIAQLSDDKKTAVTLACWEKDKLGENFEYQIINSPSELVIKNKKISIEEKIIEKFPEDKYLRSTNAECYMGRMLSDSSGKAIGIIVIINQKKYENIDFANSVLKIFASRSSAELERLKYVKELIAAKEDAERSDKLKSEFLAQMSHEIRTPVNTILSFSSLLRESLDSNLDKQLKDSFKIIENGGRRLIRTIDLILNVSQFQSGNLIISHSSLELIELINSLLPEFKHSAEQKNLDLLFEYPSEDLTIMGDNFTVTQIFANLVHNAIKYTKEGSVKLKAYRGSSDETIVDVIDSGIGIAEEFRKNLFEPFSQEETGYTRKFEGTGLGLTLVKNYCDLNNAQISVESKKNIGSVFSIKFNGNHKSEMIV